VRQNQTIRQFTDWTLGYEHVRTPAGSGRWKTGSPGSPSCTAESTATAKRRRPPPTTGDAPWPDRSNTLTTSPRHRPASNRSPPTSNPPNSHHHRDPCTVTGRVTRARLRRSAPPLQRPDERRQRHHRRPPRRRRQRTDPRTGHPRRRLRRRAPHRIDHHRRTTNGGAWMTGGLSGTALIVARSYSSAVGSNAGRATAVRTAAGGLRPHRSMRGVGRRPAGGWVRLGWVG